MAFSDRPTGNKYIFFFNGFMAKWFTGGTLGYLNSIYFRCCGVDRALVLYVLTMYVPGATYFSKALITLGKARKMLCDLYKVEPTAAVLLCCLVTELNSHGTGVQRALVLVSTFKKRSLCVSRR